MTARRDWFVTSVKRELACTLGEHMERPGGVGAPRGMAKLYLTRSLT